MADESFNPYQAPRDHATDVPSASPDSAFFAISTSKLVVLAIASFNLYIIYWMYQQWKALRDRSGAQVSPVGRAIFSIFYCGSLFSRMRMSAAEAGVAGTASTGALAGMFIVVAIFSNVTRRLDMGLFWLVELLLVIPVAIMQNEVNAYLRKVTPNADMNERYSAWNILLLVIGSLFWILVIIGTVAPE
jgi:hypothetical protein